MMDLPHSRCNWVTNQLMIGACPTHQTIHPLRFYGFDIFVNLQEDEKTNWYHTYLPKNVEKIHFPVPSGGVPDKKIAIKLTKYLIRSMKIGMKVYIHCRGGNGRAGTIAALIYGYMNKLDAGRSIKMMEELKKNRTDMSRSIIPIPETQIQVDFLVEILGEDIDFPVPDRRDESWKKNITY